MKGIEKYEETRKRKREVVEKREEQGGKARDCIGNNPTPENTPIVIPALARLSS